MMLISSARQPTTETGRGRCNCGPGPRFLRAWTNPSINLSTPFAQEEAAIVFQSLHVQTKRWERERWTGDNYENKHRLDLGFQWVPCFETTPCAGILLPPRFWSPLEPPKNEADMHCLQAAGCSKGRCGFQAVLFWICLNLLCWCECVSSIFLTFPYCQVALHLKRQRATFNFCWPLATWKNLLDPHWIRHASHTGSSFPVEPCASWNSAGTWEEKVPVTSRSSMA